MTDEYSELILAKEYQPYGEVLYSAGDAISSYGFTGEMTDVSGLVYLRSRYYAPETGRFTTRDTWSGDYIRPLSLNRWGYVEGNPVNYVDPMGHDYNNGATLLDRRDLTDWLPRAAVYMATDPEVQEIKRLICSTDGVENFRALYKFYNLVRDGARFDVKDKIKEQLGQSIRLGEYWYEYSSTGNILYGFYGTAAGFNEEILHRGAGYAQVTDLIRWIWAGGNSECFPDIGGPQHHYDTPDDYHAVGLGAWLYQKYFKTTGVFTQNNFLEGLDIYEYTWGLHRVPDPGNYQPNTTGSYAADEFDH